MLSSSLHRFLAELATHPNPHSLMTPAAMRAANLTDEQQQALLTQDTTALAALLRAESPTQMKVSQDLANNGVIYIVSVKDQLRLRASAASAEGQPRSPFTVATPNQVTLTPTKPGAPTLVAQLEGTIQWGSAAEMSFHEPADSSDEEVSTRDIPTRPNKAKGL